MRSRLSGERRARPVAVVHADQADHAGSQRSPRLQGGDGAHPGGKRFRWRALGKLPVDFPQHDLERQMRFATRIPCSWHPVSQTLRAVVAPHPPLPRSAGENVPASRQRGQSIRLPSVGCRPASADFYRQGKQGFCIVDKASEQNRARTFEPGIGNTSSTRRSGRSGMATPSSMRCKPARQV